MESEHVRAKWLRKRAAKIRNGQLYDPYETAHLFEAADLIDSQAAEIVRHRANAAESVGLAGERIGTIAALRHEVADQAAEIERLQEWNAEEHTDKCFWKTQADDSDKLLHKRVAELEKLNKAVQRTADGELPELTVWWPSIVEVHCGFVQYSRVRVMLSSGDVRVDIGECYSTSELAETARLAALSTVQETKQDD